MKNKLMPLFVIGLILTACETSYLETPSGLQGRQVGNSVMLAWNMVEGATSYEVQCGSRYKQVYSSVFTDDLPAEGYNTYVVSALNSKSRSKPATIIVFYDSNSSGGGGGGNGGDGNGGNTNTTEQIVKENVSATISYSQYSWWITINTYLGGKLSTSNIKYGIECGYSDYNWQKYAEGSGTQYSMRACVFIDADGSPFALEGFYWGSYLALENDDNKTSGETDLWNSIIKDYMKYESSAKSHYRGRVFVEVDGVRYYIKYFGNTSDTNGGNNDGSSKGVTELYLTDYTAWPTYLKVVYAYKSDLNVTSAKIYYGENRISSSVNATVSGALITAYISGLKKNTVYYVSASATTSEGTVHSEESLVRTAIK